MRSSYHINTTGSGSLDPHHGNNSSSSSSKPASRSSALPQVSPVMGPTCAVSLKPEACGPPSGAGFFYRRPWAPFHKH